MNRSAYFTTSLAIKTLSNLSKADIVLHGEENIPKGPVIFVINHFTRVETLFMPYHIFKLTGTPAWSLASDTLFKGGLAKFFDMVGVISTKDPKRDELILKSLLTGEAHWIIFPEGSMVKTKKIMRKGKFLVSASSGKHRPHTGAASLALRAEYFRAQLMEHSGVSGGKVAAILENLGIASCDMIKDKKTSIVPVNLTYYPIRAKDNIASTLASKLVKDLPDRVIEEIMTEGTMLLSGVDLDIRFGKPIFISGFMQDEKVAEELKKPPNGGLDIPESLEEYMRDAAHEIMQHYMQEIYGLTTINHEHLYASFLKLYPYSKIKEESLNRRVFYAASLISDEEEKWGGVHGSLKENQINLLIDDRYGKYTKFLDLALEKGVVVRQGEYLKRSHAALSEMVSFHRRRIENPIEVITNEVEPLKEFQKLIFSIAWQPDFLLKRSVLKYLQTRELERYDKDCRFECQEQDRQIGGGGKPFLFRSWSKRIGVVLVHSYLSVPDEVKSLANHLRKRGIYVYAPRLAGHGTSPEDLARRTHGEWLQSVETGYAIMRHICDKVVLGGVSVGGCLAFDLASRCKDVSGVFSICSPYKLQDYSSTFMPAIDVWNRILGKINRDALEEKYFEFSADNPHVNYGQNPVLGVREVGRFLDNLKDKLPSVKQPAMVVHADQDPVVDQEGSRLLYENLGSPQKEFSLLSFDRHVIINGEGAERVHRLISDFIKHL